MLRAKNEREGSPLIPDISRYNNPFSVPPTVKETASEDGAVLLDVEKGICFSLNPVGLRIWSLLKQGSNIDQIADALENDYPVVPRPQLLEDVYAFMHELESRQLLLVQDGTVRRAKKGGFFKRLLRRSTNSL